MNEILDFIRPYISNEVFLLALVMGAFYLGIIVYKRTNLTILQPLLIAMIVIIPFLKITGIDYQTFYTHTRILNFMLGPSVVALGYVLYEQLEHIKGNVISILSAVFVGSIVGIVSVVLIAKVLEPTTSLLLRWHPNRSPRLSPLVWLKKQVAFRRWQPLLLLFVVFSEDWWVRSFYAASVSKAK